MTAPGQVRAGGEKRGNSYDRAARKTWMLSPGAGFGGDSQTVPCTHCKTTLSYATVEADRITPGGTYRRSNVQPACRHCNADRSNSTSWTFKIQVQVQVRVSLTRTSR